MRLKLSLYQIHLLKDTRNSIKLQENCSFLGDSAHTRTPYCLLALFCKISGLLEEYSAHVLNQISLENREPTLP